MRVCACEIERERVREVVVERVMGGEQQAKLDYDLGGSKNGARESRTQVLCRLCLTQNLKSSLNLVCMHANTRAQQTQACMEQCYSCFAILHSELSSH